jgi:hypothetical protein
VRIRDVLSRRSDLSTFLVHLTRDFDEVIDDGHVYTMTARESLGQIIESRRLIAVTPMGFAAEQDDPADPAKQTQRTVCFSETPLEHTWAMFEQIDDRQRNIKLQPYGLALTKVLARRHAVNPVWYVDMTPAGHQWLAHDVWALRDAAVATGDFHNQPIARLLPFFDWMGGPFPPNSPGKEFWWEREWRHQGDFDLAPIWDKIIWLCPEADHDDFRDQVKQAMPGNGEPPEPAVIDPSWGVEEIIASLVGLPLDEVSVFAAAAPDADAAPTDQPPF